MDTLLCEHTHSSFSGFGLWIQGGIFEGPTKRRSGRPNPLALQTSIRNVDFILNIVRFHQGVPSRDLNRTELIMNNLLFIF